MTKKAEKNQKYIVRCTHAGVFFGEIKERQGQDVVMTNVRKLWYWSGACAVEELAVNGVSQPKDCKFTVIVEEMTVMDPVQIIPCTKKAAKVLGAVDVWRA